MNTRKINLLWKTIALSGVVVLSACGESQEKADSKPVEATSETAKTSEAQTVGGIEEKIALGKQIYTNVCTACHQAEGQGIPGAFPPLAASDYLNEDVERTIDIIVHGKSGEITVNGEKYNSVMAAQSLSDEEVANVLIYVYNSWGNNKSEVTPEMVAKSRSEG